LNLGTRVQIVEIIGGELFKWLLLNKEWMFPGIGIFILGVLVTVIKVWVNRSRLKLTVHNAFFTGSTIANYFINVTNLSRKTELEVTHIYFECGIQMPVLRKDRMLPVRLKPGQSWETWISVANIPENFRENACKLARARLSNGKIIKSVENKNVPERGTVPGGPIHTII